MESLRGDVFLQETHFPKSVSPLYMANADKKIDGILISINDSLVLLM